MPTLNDMTQKSLSGFQAVENPKTPPPASVPGTVLGRNPNIRCPLPPFNSSPDVLRQFNESGKVPATRVIPLPVATTLGTGTTIFNGTSTSSGGSGGSGGLVPTPTPSLAPATQTISVPILVSGGSYLTTIQLAKSYQLQSVTSNQPVEIRLYASKIAQISDSPRLTDTAPPFETTVNLITDVVLDTAPYLWTWQNRVAVNADSPQTLNAYITVFNPAGHSVSAATLTILYIPLVTT
jgi:hypothetical protein